jgi:hypothetical protein
MMKNGKSAAAWKLKINLLSFRDLHILRALEESAGYFDFPGEMKPSEIEVKKNTEK